MSASLATRFPRLDHFLNAYMHQDWRLFGNSLEDVVREYASDSSASDVRSLQREIHFLLVSEGDRIEADYYRLFPNSVLPSAWHMTVADWLRYVAKLAGKYSPTA